MAGAASRSATLPICAGSLLAVRRPFLLLAAEPAHGLRLDRRGTSVPKAGKRNNRPTPRPCMGPARLRASNPAVQAELHTVLSASRRGGSPHTELAGVLRRPRRVTVGTAHS